jgi:hypothetical protein
MKAVIIKISLCLVLLLSFSRGIGWGFFGHRMINYYAVFMLPPEMLVLFKEQINFLSEHAVDPDKRRYAIPEEAPRHYIDIDRYGSHPYPDLPRNWSEAVSKYSEDTLFAYGIVPWYVQIMQARLTKAFEQKDQARILRLAAEIGHYISDAHVPLHATRNHNGQYSNQNGIHGFWESRIPELFAEKEYDFLLGKAAYIEKPGDYIWARVLESGAAADSVLSFEAALNASFSPDQKFAFEERSGKVIRQYSTSYSRAYSNMLNGMVERRMRQCIFAVASYWYTAWVNAGQPNLRGLTNKSFTESDLKEFEELNTRWQAGKTYGQGCE